MPAAIAEDQAAVAAARRAYEHRAAVICNNRQMHEAEVEACAMRATRAEAHRRVLYDELDSMQQALDAYGIRVAQRRRA